METAGTRDKSAASRYGGGSGSTRSGVRTPRKGWRVFLKPGWIISLVLILAFSYFAFTLLAPWQLNKDEDIQTRNEQISQAFERDPVPYSELFGADGSITPQDEWSRVTMTGRYLAEDEVLLRLRPVNENPAFHSLTPFELDDGRIALVNRGFEPSSGAIVPDIAPAPTDDVTIVAIARLNEGVPASAPLQDSGYQQVYGINTGQVSELTGLTLGQDYLQLAEDQPGVLNAQPIPMLDRGSHLSYGLQWIAFGVMAPIGLGYFIWAEMRERRRERAEREEMANGKAVETDVAEPEVVQVPAERTVAAAGSSRRRSRYGDAHQNHYEKFARRDEERF